MPSVIRTRIKKFTNILSKEQTVILETAFFTMIPILLTKITGQLFSLIAASIYGAKDSGLSQFFLASSLPDLLTNILLGGALGSIIIPTLISVKRKQGAEAFLKLYSSIINSVLVVFGILAFIIALLADIILPLFMHTLIPGENSIAPEELAEVISMMRVLFIPQIILGFSVLISSGLNIYNRYIVPQFAPLFFNFGRIFALLFLVPAMDYSPWGIVIGVIIGSVLHLIIQLPLFWHVGLRYFFTFQWSRHIREILIVSFPRTLALLMENAALTFVDFLSFAIGGLVAFNLANSISLVIPSLFGATFAYASFTTLSELFEDREMQKVESVVSKTLNEMLFLALPFVITILILRIAVVRLTFGIIPGTRLDLDDTYQIAWILLWFATGHIFICGKWFMHRVFYAAKNTSIPFIVSLLSLVLVVNLSILFTNLFSHNTQYSIASTEISTENFLERENGRAAIGGVGLGISLAYTIEFLILIIIFHKSVVKLKLKTFLISIGKKFIAGGVMFVVMYFIYKSWNALTYSLPTLTAQGYRGSTTVNLIILTLMTVVTSFIVYYLVCYLLKVEELKILRKYLNPIFRLGGLRIR